MNKVIATIIKGNKKQKETMQLLMIRIILLQRIIRAPLRKD